jgi:hypothetical protein
MVPNVTRGGARAARHPHRRIGPTYFFFALTFLSFVLFSFYVDIFLIIFHFTLLSILSKLFKKNF